MRDDPYVPDLVLVVDQLEGLSGALELRHEYLRFLGDLPAFGLRRFPSHEDWDGLCGRPVERTRLTFTLFTPNFKSEYHHAGAPA
jgi:hypothetical protein